MRIVVPVVGLFISLLVFGGIPARANPNNRDPEASLAVHGGSESEELAGQGVEKCKKASAAMRDFLDKEKKNHLDKIDPKLLGDTRVLVLQASRLAARLRVRREPAGFDFMLRADPLILQADRLIRVIRELPQASNFTAKVRQQVQQGEKQRQRDLAQIVKLVDQQKWPEAERELYEVLDKWNAVTAYLSDPEQVAIYGPFAKPQQAIEMAMLNKRRGAAMEELKKRYKDELPNYDGILSTMRAASDSIRSSGMADVGKGAVAGPECAVQALQLWEAVHVATLHCRGFQLAELAGDISGYTGAANTPQSAGTTDVLTAAYTKFNAAMLDSLGMLIEADVSRVTETDAPARYMDYIAALAPWVQRFEEGADSPLLARLEPALDKLAQRSPMFAASVNVYRERTDDLLRWRRRTAELQAQSRMPDYLPIDNRLFEGTISRDSYVGLFQAVMPTKDAPTLLASAPDVIPTAAERMIGKTSSLVKFHPLAGGRTSVNTYFNRTYATIPKSDLAVDAAISELKSDLAITDQSPPLTLRAAVAIDCAEKGGVEAVGGTISGFHLESVIVRFAALPNAAAPLVLLNKLPSPPTDVAWNSQMMMRFEVKPHWVWHRYFFVDLSKGAGTAN